MSVQLDIEVVDGLTVIQLSQGNGSAIHKPFNRNERAIDKKAVVARKIEISMGILITKSRACDTNRSYAPMPRRAVLPEPLTSYPFDARRSAEGFNEATDFQRFNRDLSI